MRIEAEFIKYKENVKRKLMEAGASFFAARVDQMHSLVDFTAGWEAAEAEVKRLDALVARLEEARDSL